MKRAILAWLKQLFNALYDGSLLQRDVQRVHGLAAEAVWHHVFREGVREEGLRLNMGRWAGGAPFFYVLHRVLESVKPAVILEMGLGESTKFIAQVAEQSPHVVQHTVLENDREWVRFFSEREALGEKTTIEVVGLESRTGREDGIEGLAYAGVAEVHWERADVIVVDGPHGRGRYARSNVLDFVPHVDADRSFVILFDDSQRPGEANTIDELVKRFSDRGVEVHVGHYSGIKRCTVVCSKGLGWLKTL